jgi:hypothetical protein
LAAVTIIVGYLVAAFVSIVVGFAVGSVAFVSIVALDVIVKHEPAARALWRGGRFLILAYAQSIVLMVGFLVLSVLGLA